MVVQSIKLIIREEIRSSIKELIKEIKQEMRNQTQEKIESVRAEIKMANEDQRHASEEDKKEIGNLLHRMDKMEEYSRIENW